MSKTIRAGLCLALTLLLANAQASTPSLSSGAGFQPNLGQMDDQVAFWAQRNGIDLFVTRQGELVHRLRGNEDKDWVLIERLENANALQPQAAASESTQINYLGKNGSQTGFSTPQINLGEAWAGIHADLQLIDDQFEKRFHLSQGADVNAIRVALDGVDELSIAADGRLILATGLGNVELSAPIAWQDIGMQRKPVAVNYTLTGASSYGFALGKFDPEYGVTIDPIIRSTFVGGNGDESIEHLEVTSDSVYITGNTSSGNFPGTTGGYQPAIIRNTVLGSNIYIARYSLDLTTLMQATFFGAYGPFGNGGQSGGAAVKTLVVTADGVFITGPVPGNPPQGSPAHIPTTASVLQAAAVSDQYGAFVARLSLDLKQLLAATYYSGTSQTTAWPMVVSDTGVFIAGNSGTTNLPGLANGANNTPPTPAGSGAAYVAKLSLDLTTAIAASWISGGGWQMDPRAMTLGVDGSVYVAGDGTGGLFETTGAAQPNRIGGSTKPDGFIVRLNSDLSEIHRSTYLGSSGFDRIDSLAFADGKLYVAGDAGEANFPVSGDGAITAWGANGSFVAVLAADLSAIDGASFYRGNTSTSIAEVRVNSDDVYLTGTTTSTVLPATTGGAEPTNNTGGTCGFAATFNLALTQVKQSTFVACGGGKVQVFAADFGNNSLYFSGRTQRIDLPGSATGAQPAKSGGGSYDAFIIAMTADLAGPKPNADIEVIKTGSDKRIANKYILYTINVKNIGPDTASEVLIEDTLPAEISAASWQCNGFNGASCPHANGSGSISETAAIPLGGRLEYKICGYAGFSSTVSNTASASVPSHTLDPQSNNNSDTVIMQDPRLFADGFEDPTLPPWCPSAL